MLVKGIEPWFPLLYINVLAIKPPHHFVKQYDINCIHETFNMFPWTFMNFFVNVYNNIWTLIFFISSLVVT
jgi:hypothetical protein